MGVCVGTVPAMHSLAIPVVPDPNDSRAVQVFVDVVADGVPVRMLLDTGAFRTAVPFREQAEQLSAPDRDTSSPAEPLIRLRTLQWDSLAVRDLAPSMQAPGWPHPPPLGNDVLGAYRCYFRFSAGVLEVDGPPPPTDELLQLPTAPGSHPRVPVQWDGTTVDALWDTGAGITIVSRAWAEEHPEIVTITSEFGSGTDAYGRSGSNPKGRLAPCRIGNVDFPEQDCGVANHAVARITLGLPLISQADWYLDFPAQRWVNSPRPVASA